MSLTAEMESLEHDFRAVFEEIEKRALFSGDRLPYYQRSGFSHPLWPVLTVQRPGSFSALRWGLIPGWVKEREQALKLQQMTLNARSETMFKLPSFRGAAGAGRRCLIPVDGFFEPYHVEGRGYPFYIYRRDGRPFALGGIYESWQGPESGNVYTGFSVLTLPSKGLVDRIHVKKHRMPLIIPPERYEAWLDCDLPRERVEELVQVSAVDDLQAHPVSRQLYSRSPEAVSPGVRELHHYGIEAVDRLAEA